VARDGAVIVCTEGGFIRAYSNEGLSLWTYSVSGRLAPFLARSRDGFTWFAVQQSRSLGAKSLQVLNRTGRKLGELLFDEPVTFAPLAGLDGRVFVFFE
jgi:hypothetical protein